MGQLGDTFRERRASLGISLDTAQHDTKIRMRLLQALEAGEYDRLPNPGYVRGYVSSYARYLELDPVPLLAMYRAETGAGRYHDINVSPDQSVPRRHEQHAIPWRVALIAFAVVVVIAIGSWIAYRASRPVTTPPLPTTTGATSTGDKLPTQTQTAPFTVKVGVQGGSASAVKVIVDGGTGFDGSMTGGQSKTFLVAQSITLTIGKPSVVTVTRDGKPVDLGSKSPATVTLKASKP